MLADLVTLFHASLYIVITTFFLLAFKYPFAKITSLLLLGGVIFFDIIFGGCILTDIEASLRPEGSGVERGYTLHYIEKIFEVTIPSGLINWITLSSFIIVILLIIVDRCRRSKSKQKNTQKNKNKQNTEH